MQNARRSPAEATEAVDSRMVGMYAPESAMYARAPKHGRHVQHERSNGPPFHWPWAAGGALESLRGWRSKGLNPAGHMRARARCEARVGKQCQLEHVPVLSCGGGGGGGGFCFFFSVLPQACTGKHPFKYSYESGGVKAGIPSSLLLLL